MVDKVNLFLVDETLDALVDAFLVGPEVEGELVLVALQGALTSISPLLLFFTLVSRRLSPFSLAEIVESSEGAGG